MQLVMQRHCAVFRDRPLLEEGDERLAGIRSSLCDDLGLKDHSLVWNTDLAEAIELDNMAAQAAVSLRSAISRTESRGACPRGLPGARRRELA